jgi:hypothetical protein
MFELDILHIRVRGRFEFETFVPRVPKSDFFQLQHNIL